MILVPEALDIFFSDLQSDFNDGYKNAPSYFEKYSRVKQSKGRDSRYGWPDRLPNFREWEALGRSRTSWLRSTRSSTASGS